MPANLKSQHQADQMPAELTALMAKHKNNKKFKDRHSSASPALRSTKMTIGC
jgi:hypothetical protein